MLLLIGLLIVLTTVTGFGLLFVWALRPLLSSRDSTQYRRFILADMYTLVLQIGIVGLCLRSSLPNDDDRFLRMFGCCALFLALIWRFIVAALDDHKVRGTRERVPVLFVAPIHLLVRPSLCFVGMAKLNEANQTLLPPIFLICGALLPMLFRRIYIWAIRSNKNAGNESPASSDN